MRRSIFVRSLTMGASAVVLLALSSCGSDLQTTAVAEEAITGGTIASEPRWSPVLSTPAGTAVLITPQWAVTARHVWNQDHTEGTREMAWHWSLFAHAAARAGVHIPTTGDRREP